MGLPIRPRNRNLEGPQRHNMLTDDLYAHLLDQARKGDILAITGGPNCRTWSTLLHKKQHDGSPGRQLRGRGHPYCWGLPHLSETEKTKTDEDSLLYSGCFRSSRHQLNLGTHPCWYSNTQPTQQTTAGNPPLLLAPASGPHRPCKPSVPRKAS